MKAKTTETLDKRATALRDNLKRRKAKAKQTKEQVRNAEATNKK